MASYSTDKDGLVEVRDEHNRLLFNRTQGVAVAGWSNHPQVKSKFKNVNESSGKADTREK